MIANVVMRIEGRQGRVDPRGLGGSSQCRPNWCRMCSSFVEKDYYVVNIIKECRNDIVKSDVFNLRREGRATNICRFRCKPMELRKGGKDTDLTLGQIPIQSSVFQCGCKTFWDI